ncbi:MAG: DNA repair protein RecN [Chloroflexi bacterium]|nr:DNA repair protein RecN [Chloroflexota bacterium]
MLERLTIRNFAIIDHLELCWASGLTVITGETGAGKSILIDAVGALLGDRLGPDAVRTGARRATVDGVFVLNGDLPTALAELLTHYGLELDEDALIVSRDIGGPGSRGGARVNGRPVPLAALQQLGEELIDVHGQSEHMALLQPRDQLDYLDRFAGLLPMRATVTTLVRELRAVRQARRALETDERAAIRELDLLRHELAEIEAADLQPDEETELLGTRTRLQHVERLREAATAAYQALTGAEEADQERPGAIDLLAEAVTACADGARFDATLGGEPLEGLNSALAQAEDAARGLRSYLDGVEADPALLDRTEERLFAISELKRKYGADVQVVLDYAAEARRRLEQFEQRDARRAELEASDDRLRGQLGQAARELSRRRRLAARELSGAVEHELRDLRMADTRLDIAVTQGPDDAGGVELDQRLVAFTETGVDRVDFLVAANRGDEPRPLARVASGGELARLALAVKTVLARTDPRPTLIFDEVDAGIGGRTAPVIGQKLWTVAQAGHQVLCVTHLPQVAVYADRQYAVAKHAEEPDGRPSATVSEIAGTQRLDELASMLAGAPTASSRQSARELLERARTFKKAAAPDGHSLLA